MNLNHIDLPVPDTRETQAFFIRHFGFKTVFSRDDGLVVLHDEDGFALSLSPSSAESRTLYPGGFHIGFNVDNEDELVEVYRSLVVAAAPIVRPIGDLAGAMAFHCKAPGSILVEVAYRQRR